jgi:hypothetical protein
MINVTTSINEEQERRKVVRTKRRIVMVNGNDKDTMRRR